MNERERLLAHVGRAVSQADRHPAVEGVAGALVTPDEEAAHPGELGVVGDGARRADDAAHLARRGIDEDRRPGAIDEVRPGTPAAASPGGPPALPPRLVHLVLLSFVEVPVAALGD